MVSGRLVLMVHMVDPLTLPFSPIYLPINQDNDEKKIKIYIVLHITVIQIDHKATEIQKEPTWIFLSYLALNACLGIISW